MCRAKAVKGLCAHSAEGIAVAAGEVEFMDVEAPSIEVPTLDRMDG